MAKGSAILALLGKPKGKPVDDGEDDDMSSDEGSGDYLDLLKEAFPNEDWDEDRAHAFKELIRACMGE